MEITDTRYPIGVHSFEKLRQEGYMYIDKTGYIRKLLKNDYYFLSRPRRFGKSLLLSTLEAYFRGKKELFEGLEVYGHEHDWVEYPVVHVDFASMNGADTGAMLIRKCSRRSPSCSCTNTPGIPHQALTTISGLSACPSTEATPTDRRKGLRPALGSPWPQGDEDRSELLLRHTYHRRMGSRQPVGHQACAYGEEPIPTTSRSCGLWRI